MEYTVSALTDIGIQKKTNQDSMLVKQAEMDGNNILMAAVCDGMGGLSEGEVASSIAVESLSAWFEECLPELIDADQATEKKNIYRSLNQYLKDLNENVASYGISKNISCGTTCAALICTSDRFYTVNIGDSRVYLFRNGLHYLTKDQTVIQQAIENGTMTPEQAIRSPDRSVLLQCIGASEEITPTFSSGKSKIGDLFMLCSDGFRHKISEIEFTKICDSPEIVTKEDLEDISHYLIELNKTRKEKDNISVIMIKLSRY